ncbi:hypothetical protein TRFO_29055 [Tritrichomonas foetus]|uniref:Uncharacterized protein n=1 Tax=Tritrichomonas foetus TaxID=1144522 RepID=A0A1J4K249_9EUKA|nr:hypothetical protein TRFO_29055 [Tritrichomonas foetus]|eukprot:OHT03557.1 hypothetical protein TRFO_29055 [Tritrichomonas foetus]
MKLTWFSSKEKLKKIQIKQIEKTLYFIFTGTFILILFFAFHYFRFVFRIRLTNKPQIYIVSIVNSPDWVRSKILYEKWGKKFIERYPLSVFKFASRVMHKDFKDRTLHVKTVYPNYRAFFYYFNDAVDDFLTKTSLPWIYRTTEDCLVDVDLLDEYILNISKTYSPYQFVVRGHSAYYSEDKYFIHGGSGWLMSRAAAGAYQKLLPSLILKYENDSLVGDDVIMSVFTEAIGLEYNDIFDKYFLGSPLNNKEIEIIRNKTWMDLPLCTDRPDEMVPIKDIVFWHSGRSDNFPMVPGIQVKEAFPDNICYDQFSKVRRLCFS